MKQKKSQPKPKAAPRIKFITEDGLVLMDRTSSDWVFEIKAIPGRDEKDFIYDVMEADARRKGVRIISSSIVNNNAVAVVDWLSKK